MEEKGKIGGAPGAGQVYEGDETQRGSSYGQERAGGIGGAGAATAMAKEPEAKGFIAFRDWVNEKLRDDTDITVPHAGINCKVVELTADAQLKLALPNRGGFEHVAFDETYIEALLPQLV